MKELPEDLKRILNNGAKVYNVNTKLQGKVSDVSSDAISIDFGKSVEQYELEEFKQLLLDDIIVANSRLTMGKGNNFKVLPRVSNPPTIPKPSNTESKQNNKETTSKPQSKPDRLEIGYINEKTGKFSTEHKRGYTKIEYRKTKQQVVLELDDDQLNELKKMGLIQ